MRGARENALPDLLVLLHLAVADVDDAVGMQGDIVLVGHQHNRVALLVEAREQRHDVVAGDAVQIPGGLIGQQNGPPDSSLGLCIMRPSRSTLRKAAWVCDTEVMKNR